MISSFRVAYPTLINWSRGWRLEVMKRLTLIPLVLSSGLLYGSSIDVFASNPNPVSVGVFGVGDALSINVQGFALLAPFPPYLKDVLTNPDGSLIPTFCPGCSNSYSYFEQGQAYPTVAGGDGINHFVGGGGNYDLYMPQHWASEGAQTTDTTDPGVIRFGSLAFQWNSGEWATLGFGGTLVSPGGSLNVVVVDEVGSYGNNSGAYLMNWESVPGGGNVPEPATLGMIGIGLMGLGIWKKQQSAHQ